MASENRVGIDLNDGVAGQRVVVTAGAGGIGLAIAERLIAQGARVVVCDVSEDALEAFGERFPEHGRIRADVADEAEVDALFDLARRQLGGLDALVNNAGIAGPTAPVEDIAPADWRRCLEVGLTGQFLCARRAVPMLREAGGGAIVNMSSVAGRFGYPFRSPYSAAKFGVIGFTQTLAKELGAANIRVNAVLPGIVEGPRIEQVIAARAKQLGQSVEAAREGYLSHVSLRRMVTPYDVAAMVLFLLSAAGRNVSGQSLGVDANVETL